MKEHKEEWDQAEKVTHAVHATVCTPPAPVCPPYFWPYKILGILHQRFFHQLPSDSSQDGHLSIQRKKKAGHSVFLWTGGLLLFPEPWPELFLKVSPVSSLIWATARRLLLRFCSASFHMTQWPTYLSLPLMDHIPAYLVLPFPRVITKERPLIIWWSPPTSPQVQCAAILHSCLCVFE